MKRVITTLIMMGPALLLSGQLWAGGGPGTPRLGSTGSLVAPQKPVARNRRSSRYVAPVYPYVYYYSPQGYFYSPRIVVSPYYYPYYLPPTVVVNAPFFCVLHQEGFVSRVGMLDHLSGTHKIPLAAAASVCPDGVENCLFPSY